MRTKTRDSILKSSTALVAVSTVSLPALLINPQGARADPSRGVPWLIKASG